TSNIACAYSFLFLCLPSRWPIHACFPVPPSTYQSASNSEPQVPPLRSAVPDSPKEYMRARWRPPSSIVHV
ncbi:hypothetical protein FIBSPDRAFT_870512, partial [Athelia psychrophila]